MLEYLRNLNSQSVKNDANLQYNYTLLSSFVMCATILLLYYYYTIYHTVVGNTPRETLVLRVFQLNKYHRKKTPILTASP